MRENTQLPGDDSSVISSLSNVMGINIILFVVFACAVVRTLGATYQRTSQLAGQSFLDAFHFEAIPDPTNGRV
jgi:hypothetical protein